MSEQDGSITLDWGDGQYRFRLAFGQWAELQEAVNRPRVAMGAPMIGPGELLQAMARGNCWPHEVREVLRLGLIGGGMKSDRALVLVKRYVEQAPWARNNALAGNVLARSMIGPPDDDVGKETPPADAETSAADHSDSLTSTGSVLQ